MTTIRLRPKPSFDHATSEDLLTWTHHGPVVEAGGPGDCDAHEVGDGCIIEHEGRWHLVYHCRPTVSSTRRFAMAVSDDLWNWTKLPGDGSPTFIPDRELSGWREEGIGLEIGKDPSIIYQDGRYHMYYVCQKLVEPIDEPLKQTHTGINVATSTDLVHWEDHGAVIEDRRIDQSDVRSVGFRDVQELCSMTARSICSRCTSTACNIPSETTLSTSARGMSWARGTLL